VLDGEGGRLAAGALARRRRGRVGLTARDAFICSGAAAARRVFERRRGRAVTAGASVLSCRV